MVIKPSGVRYEHLRPEQMVVLDLDGRVVDGDLKPSSDTYSPVSLQAPPGRRWRGAHALRGHATAFAAVGQPIPVVLTAIADEFGGPIPCGGSHSIGDESIGK